MIIDFKEWKTDDPLVVVGEVVSRATSYYYIGIILDEKLMGS